jgi:SAM-dependent methyltransferase
VIDQSVIDEDEFWSDPDRPIQDFYGEPAYDVVSVAARIIAAHPIPMRGLDLGCGPGRLTNLVASTDESMTVHGVDISRPAIFEAVRTSPSNTRYWHGDGRTIPRAVTGNFDLVWSVTMLQHIPYEAQLNYISQVASRLRHSGVFLFTVAVSDQPPSEFFYPWPDTDDLVEVVTGWFAEVSVSHDVVNDWCWIHASA